MAIERLAPDAILVSQNLSGTVADIQDDPHSPDSKKLTANTHSQDTILRASFPSPSQGLKPGATQTINAWVNASAGPSVSVQIDLYESAVFRKMLSSGLASQFGTLFTGSFTDADLTTDGTGVEVRIHATGVAGGPFGDDRTGEVGALEWNAEVIAPNAAMSAAAALGATVIRTGGVSADLSASADVAVGPDALLVPRLNAGLNAFPLNTAPLNAGAAFAPRLEADLAVSAGFSATTVKRWPFNGQLSASADVSSPITLTTELEAGLTASASASATVTRTGGLEAGLPVAGSVTATPHQLIAMGAELGAQADWSSMITPIFALEGTIATDSDFLGTGHYAFRQLSSDLSVPADLEGAVSAIRQLAFDGSVTTDIRIAGGTLFMASDLSVLTTFATNFEKIIPRKAAVVTGSSFTASGVFAIRNLGSDLDVPGVFIPELVYDAGGDGIGREWYLVGEFTQGVALSAALDKDTPFTATTLPCDAAFHPALQKRMRGGAALSAQGVWADTPYERVRVLGAGFDGATTTDADLLRTGNLLAASAASSNVFCFTAHADRPLAADLAVSGASGATVVSQIALQSGALSDAVFDADEPVRSRLMGSDIDANSDLHSFVRRLIFIELEADFPAVDATIKANLRGTFDLSCAFQGQAGIVADLLANFRQEAPPEWTLTVPANLMVVEMPADLWLIEVSI